MTRMRAGSSPVTSLRFSVGAHSGEDAGLEFVLLAADQQGDPAREDGVDLLLVVVGLIVLGVVR